jgi:formylglycine-generating enzyme required for sulfatase activity
MVNVPAPQGCTYCIDSTETTNAQYATFIAARADGGKTDAQDPWCAWNKTYIPEKGLGPDDYPVLADWCDAYEYCRWAGKRLCGKIGGGPTGFNDYGSPILSEWYNACSKGGTMKYPYGDVYVPDACNADGVPALIPVATAPICNGGYFGIFDMSGNAQEWENSCQTQIDANDDCSLRGVQTGPDPSLPEDPACSTPRAAPRTFSAGIRCCVTPD